MNNVPAKHKEVVFNKATGIPTPYLMACPRGPIQLDWTVHALDELAKEYPPSTEWEPPDYIQLFNGHVSIFELGVKSDRFGKVDARPSKVGIRIPISRTQDLCMVLSRQPNSTRWTVVTAYFNRHDDHHATLRAERVSVPVLAPN